MKMIILIKNNLLLLMVLLFLLTHACRETAVPKPEGYFRIDLPKRDYIAFDDSAEKTHNLPVTFEYPSYGKLSAAQDPGRARAGSISTCPHTMQKFT